MYKLNRIQIGMRISNKKFTTTKFDANKNVLAVLLFIWKAVMIGTLSARITYTTVCIRTCFRVKIFLWYLPYFTGTFPSLLLPKKRQELLYLTLVSVGDFKTKIKSPFSKSKVIFSNHSTLGRCRVYLPNKRSSIAYSWFFKSFNMATGCLWKS